MYNASDFTDIDLFIRGKDNVVAQIKQEIHIVDNISAKALIGIDIAATEGRLNDLDA